MFSSALSQELARQRHADALCEAGRDRLASLPPRERRTPLGMLGRLFGDAPRRSSARRSSPATEPPSYVIGSTS